MKVDCVDISTWNSGVNYNAVKADGIVAAILRAGYGREVSQKDSQFETHYRGCRNAGIKVGIYWYSYADGVDDAEQEARACLAVLNGREIDLPVYFDMEEAWQTSMGSTKLTAMAKRFCETIEKGGYRAGVYSNLNWFYNYLDYDYLKSRYSIWLAQWSGSYSLGCDIWQNSETGDISGISGMVSLRKLYLSRNQIEDISPVAGLRNLTYLSFDGNSVSDISCLGALTGLHTLTMNSNRITDISALSSLQELKHLEIAGNDDISDYSPLDQLPESCEIETSNVSKNKDS